VRRSKEILDARHRGEGRSVRLSVRLAGVRRSRFGGGGGAGRGRLRRGVHDRRGAGRGVVGPAGLPRVPIDQSDGPSASVASWRAPTTGRPDQAPLAADGPPPRAGQRLFTRGARGGPRAASVNQDAHGLSARGPAPGSRVKSVDQLEAGDRQCQRSLIGPTQCRRPPACNDAEGTVALVDGDRAQGQPVDHAPARPTTVVHAPRSRPRPAASSAAESRSPYAGEPNGRRTDRPSPGVVLEESPIERRTSTTLSEGRRQPRIDA